MQTAIALLIVAACVAYVAWQLLRSVRTGTGSAGACCNKGCGGGEPSPASAASPAPPPPREQFIAADALRRRR